MPEFQYHNIETLNLEYAEFRMLEKKSVLSIQKEFPHCCIDFSFGGLP
jgi:hypothetical protein